MSDDYSSFERDYFRKAKRREDLKTQKSNSKQVKVYEPKSSQKPTKTQGYADEPEHPPRYDNDYYDNYNNHSRTDTYKAYVSKTPSASKIKQGDNNRSKTWKKEAVKTNNKNTGESQKDKSPKQITEWVPSSKSTLFFEEKPAMANNSNPKTLPTEVKHSSGEDSSMTSAGHSTNGTNEGRKSIEVFDFSQDRPDPIQALKTLMRKGSQNENSKNMKRNTSKEEENKEEKILDEVNSMILKEENKRMHDDNDDNLNENEEDNYSDIDARMEKKLLNNEVEIQDDSDLFNQAEVETKKTDLEALEDTERPLWEDIDTKKVLEDIKKFDHISLFSQDIKKSAWRDKRFESRQPTEGQNILELTQLREEEKPQNQQSNEEDDDYFDRVFSLKVLEEPKAFASDVFKIWGKAVSDKQFNDTSLVKNASSNSFELELMNHKSSLPAFRSCHLYKSNSTDNDMTGAKNDPLFKTNDRQIGVNNLNNQSNIFKNLIPNHDAKIWFYKDLQGVLQGPFSSRMMDDWYSKGYLPLDLDITIGNSNGFRKIRELVEVAEKNRPSVVQGNYGQSNYSYPQQNGNSQYLGKNDNMKNLQSNLSNMMSENSCPNIRTYNFSPNHQNQNNFSMATKPIMTSLYSNCSAQNYMSNPLFHSDFGTNKEANKIQMIPSTYNTHKLAYTNQIQGLDTKFEANSNQLRNLPR